MSKTTAPDSKTTVENSKTTAVKTAKNIAYGQFACVGWMLLYSLLEIVAMIALFKYNIDTNFEFGEKFLDVFDFVGDDSLSSTAYSLKIMKGLLSLTNEIILPMLIVSGICLIIVLAIKGKVHKETYVSAISKNDVSKYVLYGCTFNLVITLVLNMIPQSFMEKYNTSVGLATTGNIFLMIIATGIMGPIAEEITFRHFILQPNRRVNETYAIIVSALSFGIMHGNIIQGAYTFVLGLVFAKEDIKENNLLPSMIMHITINTSSVLISSNWSNEMAGLVSFECLALAGYILLHRKQSRTTNRKENRKVEVVA